MARQQQVHPELSISPEPCGPALDERLAMSMPGAYAAFAAIIGRVPPRWRRPVVRRLVRQGFEAFVRHDLDAVVPRYSRHVQLYPPSRAVASGQFDEVYAGRDGYLAFWRLWLATWDTMRFEVSSIIDLGDRLVLLEDMYARPRGSRAEVHQRQGRVLKLFRGRVIEERFLWSWAETLRAGGLGADVHRSDRPPIR